MLERDSLCVRTWVCVCVCACARVCEGDVMAGPDNVCQLRLPNLCVSQVGGQDTSARKRVRLQTDESSAAQTTQSIHSTQSTQYSHATANDNTSAKDSATEAVMRDSLKIQVGVAGVGGSTINGAVGDSMAAEVKRLQQELQATHTKLHVSDRPSKDNNCCLVFKMF